MSISYTNNNLHIIKQCKFNFTKLHLQHLTHVHRHNLPLKEVKNRWWKCSTIKNVHYNKWLPITKYKDEWVEYVGSREFKSPFHQHKNPSLNEKFKSPTISFKTCHLVIRYCWSAMFVNKPYFESFACSFTHGCWVVLPCSIVAW